MSMLMMFLHKI